MVRSGNAPYSTRKIIYYVCISKKSGWGCCVSRSLRTPLTVPGKKSVLQRMDEKIYHVLPESFRIARARTKFGTFLKKARGDGMVNHGYVVIRRVVTTAAVVKENTLIVDV